MSLTLYFLRHGQTTLSRDDTFCGSGLDPELTPEGREMAEAFTNAYQSKAWAGIYASSLQRTIQTAQPLCERLQLKLEARDDLQEIAYGEWEGLKKETVAQKYHDDYVKWLADPARHAPTGGELATTVAERGLRVIQEIRERFDAGNVLVVSHKATIRILLCSLLGIDVGGFRYRLGCPVASLSTVEFTANGPMLQTLADRSHLDERLKTLPGT
ncbi:MAG TPA: histidine phosphatase family protein [Pyrinomonadaceae bacterium]|jgi:probable phosphoglycerate mutase|nr:histidine phosphatase family protein [Pyrinomonadaceae bacterium]